MCDRINKKNMNMYFNNVKTMWKMMQINLSKFWKKQQIPSILCHRNNTIVNKWVRVNWL